MAGATAPGRLPKNGFVAERLQRKLLDLARHRAQLTAQRMAVANRIHKRLEDANIGLGLVASDLLRISGRDRPRDLVEGKQRPDSELLRAEPQRTRRLL